MDARVVASTRAQILCWEAALERGATRVGWKVAQDFPEIEAVIGQQPVIGHLTSETLVSSGGSFSVTALRAPRVETELVIELAGPLEPGADPKTIEDAVAGSAVGLEIVDVVRPPDDLEGIIVANVAHRACVLGSMHRNHIAAGDEARIWVNGQLRQSAPVPSSHVETLSAVSRLLAAVGLQAGPGDRILAGSLTRVEVRAGDRVVAEIEGLGCVEARLVD